jgi:hypothetical protein
MGETDFLSFLVDETLKLQKTGVAELSTLELKLQDYSMHFLKGEFIPQLQMLRFVTTFGILDIPVNWSVFSIASQDVVLGQNNDQDHLLEVIKLGWNKKFEKLLITHADGFCYIIGLDAGDEARIHDLLNPQEWLKAA